MTRPARLLVLVSLVGLGLAGCDKPSFDDCRKALTNMQQLLGTENLHNTTGGLDGEVRRCRGGSSKTAVECAIKATSLDELKRCDFYKVPEPTAGSAVGSAGSAATGSGSAASGSGSAAQ